MAARHYAKVELYNLWTAGARSPRNGWLVAKYTPDGRRCNTLREFASDEAGARAYAELWNGPELDTRVNG